jgi:hypothetical protein
MSVSVPTAGRRQKLSLTTAMITSSRASYVSALDPSCPVKSQAGDPGGASQLDRDGDGIGCQ